MPGRVSRAFSFCANPVQCLDMTRPSVHAKLILLPIVLVTAMRAQSVDVQKMPHSGYQDRILFLRGMFSDERLRYDSTGMPLDNPPVGLWTTDAFVLITEVSVEGQNLVIRGRRMVVGANSKGFYFLADNPKKRKNAPKVEIHAGVESGGTSSEIDALIGKVFLTDADSFVTLIPSYWKTCVSAGLYQVNDANYQGCRFSPEVLSVPGVKLQGNLPPGVRSVEGSRPELESVRVFRVGQGVSPPTLVFSPQPQFTSTARELNLQGVVTLGLIVDDKGTPRSIEVITPLGAGLDEQAVNTISTWNFKPARKDKQIPVATQIAIQVDFHHN